MEKKTGISSSGKRDGQTDRGMGERGMSHPLEIGDYAMGVRSALFGKRRHRNTGLWSGGMEQERRWSGSATSQWNAEPLSGKVWSYGPTLSTDAFISFRELHKEERKKETMQTITSSKNINQSSCNQKTLLVLFVLLINK